MEQLGSHWTDFNGIWYLSIFKKYLEKIHVSLDLTIITGTLHEDLCTLMIKHIAQFYLEWEMFQTKVVEKTNILCTISFYFRKSCRL